MKIITTKKGIHSMESTIATDSSKKNGMHKDSAQDSWTEFVLNAPIHDASFSDAIMSRTCSGFFLRSVSKTKDTIYRIEVYKNKNFKFDKSIPEDRHVQANIDCGFAFIRELEKIKGLYRVYTDVPLAEERYGCTIYTNDKTALYIYYSYTSDELFLTVKLNTVDSKIAFLVRDLANKYIDQEPTKHDLYVISEDASGRLMLCSIGKPGLKLERGNYSPEVIEGYEYVLDQFKEEEPFGRLVLLHGPPGTGKTHLVRGFIDELDINRMKVIFLQPEYLIRKNFHSIIHLLLTNVGEEEKVLIIIEDGDEALVPRGTDNMSAITNLLNMTDGLIGILMDIRVVVTTNANCVEVDDALQRPGRLGKIIDVGKLETEQANKVFKRLTKLDKDVFNSKATIAEVYAEANKAKGTVKSNITSKKKSIGFGK